MVDPLVDSVPERHCGDFSHLAAGAALSGTRRRQRGGRRGHGRLGKYRQCARPRILGVVVGSPDAPIYVHAVIPNSGCAVLDTPGYGFGGRAYPGRICDPELLWRRFRYYARVSDGLLWSTKCRSHLRTDAHRMGAREPIWPHAACRHAGGHRFVRGCPAHYRGVDGVVGLAPVHASFPADAAANPETARPDETRHRNGKRLLAPRKMMLTEAVVYGLRLKRNAANISIPFYWDLSRSIPH